MKTIFPEPILNLPLADIPLEGLKAHLSQGSDHQIVFMQFDRDVDLPAHSHEAQIGFVLEGEIEMTIGGEQKMYRRGDRYYIPKGVVHSAKIYAGYADITFFDERNRYSAKNKL